MSGHHRNDVEVGTLVDIALKKDQLSGILTRGWVQRILTKRASHPHGIKVMLDDGQIGRVQAIITVE